MERQPNLEPSVVDSMARFVNESNSMDGRRLKSQGVVQMFDINPNLQPRQLDQIGHFVNGGDDISERRARLNVELEQLRANPNLYLS